MDLGSKVLFTVEGKKAAIDLTVHAMGLSGGNTTKLFNSPHDPGEGLTGKKVKVD